LFFGLLFTVAIFTEPFHLEGVGEYLAPEGLLYLPTDCIEGTGPDVLNPATGDTDKMVVMPLVLAQIVIEFPVGMQDL
jgi:hypothetical protein